MITTSQKRSRAARRGALALILAGTLVASAPVHAASTQTYNSHKPLSSDDPGSYTLQTPDGSTLQYPNPQYPNHKPLRGNYPGGYTSSATTPAQAPSSGFDWPAAGAGAAGMLGLILLLTAGNAAARIARNRRHHAQLFLEIRDNTPS